MSDFDLGFRKTTVQYLREYIGDEDKLIFPSDDDLDVFLRNRINWGVYTEKLNCFKGHFYSVTSGPVLDLSITSGTTGDRYRADECTKHIEWISGTGGMPADNSTIEVSYVDVNFFAVVKDVLMAIATDRSKLAVKAQAEGMQTDLTVLRREIMAQIASIGAVTYWGR